MRVIKSIIIAIWFICQTNSISFSQSRNWVFDRIGIEDGLSNTFVSDIHCDYKGYVWMATNNGLNRYNAYDFQIYNNEPGNEKSISSNVVNCIHEDVNFNIWIGTADGLNVYNRNTGEFDRFTPGTNITGTAQKINITAISEDNSGNLWIGTSGNSVLKFNIENKTFSTVLSKQDTDHYIYPKSVRSLLLDDKNHLWVGANGTGITTFEITNPQKAKTYLYRLDAKDPSELSFAMSLLQDSKGNIWAGCFLGGLMKFDSAEDRFKLIPNPYNSNSETKNGILSITEINSNELALGSNGGGIFVFDKRSDTFTANYKSESTNSKSLSNDFVTEIYKDKTEIFWVATENGGVSVYNPLAKKFKVYTQEGDGKSDMPGKVVNTIYESEDKTIWIGTEINGFAALDRSSMKYTHFKIPNVQFEKGNTFVNTIISDGENGLWIGAEMGGLSHVDQHGKIIEQYPSDFPDGPYQLPDHDVLNLLLDQDKQLWVGAYRGISYKEGNEFHLECAGSTPKDICRDPIGCIFEYDEDRLMIGYLSKGMSIYNKRTHEFEERFTADGNEKSISSNGVNAICRDSKKRIWVATNQGLNEFHPMDNSFTHYSKRDGLPDNVLYAILEDDNGILWISTNYGLSAFNPDKKTFENYYVEDGLQSNVFRIGSAFKSKSGELFFGGVEGFNAFFPKQLKSNPHPPKIVFTDFQIFNKSVEVKSGGPLTKLIEMTDEIVLDHKQSMFSFEFVAMNYTQTAKNEYAYILKGYDEEWNYIGQRRYITFTNIPAGEYELIVKACNNDGVWNEDGMSLKLTILPPFWETWWFRLLVVLSCLFGIWLFIRIKTKSLKKRQRELESTVDERTEEIRLQKDLIEVKNEEILGSITYAKRIQSAILPTDEIVKEHLPDSFILYKPKDIVAGDFYWLENMEGKVIFAAADCTGHGVPGAMVSVVCNNALNRSVRDYGLSDPGAILNKTRELVIQEFAESHDDVQDGMDIALCVLEGNRLQFAGANNPLWIIRKGELIEIKGDKQPIGKYDNPKDYTTHSIELQKGDSIYVFSDGYVDQFGGERGKKFRARAFRELLLSSQDKTMKEQKAIIDEAFEAWRGDLEQVDDVCVFGIKI